jgi:hypothetical protein
MPDKNIIDWLTEENRKPCKWVTFYALLAKKEAKNVGT